MSSLKALDGFASEILNLRQSGLRPARLRQAEDRLTTKIFDLLKPTVRKMTRLKKMDEIFEEVNQHSLIAIHVALTTWDPEMASFSTHVHWRIRAELRNLELQHFPERRKVSENIEVRMIRLNKPYLIGDQEEETELGDMMNLDPDGYRTIEENIDFQLMRRNIEAALSRIVLPRIQAYEAEGCINKSPLHQVMRNIHIFIQRHLEERNAQVVATFHGITRERIRQITNTIEANFAKIMQEMSQDPRPITDEETRGWQLAAAIYQEQTGYDIRLQKEGHLMPSHEIEKPMGKGRTIAKTGAIEIQSIATPAGDEVCEDADTAIRPVEIVEVEAISPEGSPSSDWAVKLGEYPTRYALRTATNSVLERFPELARLRPTMLNTRRSDKIGLAFGSLRHNEAQRLCAALNEQGLRCEKILIGAR